MQYKNQLENKINVSAIDRESRNRELYEYSKNHAKAVEESGSYDRDHITKLPSLRTFFYEAGEIIMANPERKFGVITMDISQFKAVNELCGRKAGDELLAEISRQFSFYEKTRPCTKAGHARADNFQLCTYFDEEAELIGIAEDLYNSITSYPFPYKVLPSFGICGDPEPLPSVSFLKDCATIAMNSIKGKFYAHYCVFDEDMRREILREKQIENDIINALEMGQLQLYVQPKVDMRDESLLGGEALIRWRHTELGMIAPGDFIPVLEKNGFIIQVDYYMWDKVFSFLHDLQESGRELIPISINISRVHTHDGDLLKKLINLSEKYSIPPSYITLEITESAFEATSSVMFESMKKLRSFGFQLSMDDFGTGYSSLQMISTQEMDEIKIDRGFVINLDTAKGRVVLENIIRMLKGLDVAFIVEGIETEEQKELLLSYGCFKAQGFLFSRPVPIEEFDEMLKK